MKENEKVWSNVIDKLDGMLVSNPNAIPQYISETYEYGTPEYKDAKSYVEDFGYKWPESENNLAPSVDSDKVTIQDVNETTGIGVITNDGERIVTDVNAQTIKKQIDDLNNNVDGLEAMKTQLTIAEDINDQEAIDYWTSEIATRESEIAKLDAELTSETAKIDAYDSRNGEKLNVREKGFPSSMDGYQSNDETESLNARDQGAPSSMDGFGSFSLDTNYLKIEDNNSNLYYDKEDIDDLRRDINNVIDDNISKLNKNISYAEAEILASLCEETRNNVSIGSLIDEIRSQVSGIGSSLSQIESDVKLVSRKMDNKGSGGSSTHHGSVSAIASYNQGEEPTSVETGSENGEFENPVDPDADNIINDLEDPVVDETPVSEIITDGNGGNIGENVNKAILGTITFIEVLPLFEQLGKESTVNSSTETSYELKGIEKYNGKYYYKISEQNNDKSYYVEVNEKAKLDSDITDILEVKESTVKIETPDINGAENYPEVINENDVFLVTGKETYQGDTNIELAKVFDSETGKDGYVMISDLVEIKPIDSLINSSN